MTRFTEAERRQRLEMLEKAWASELEQVARTHPHRLALARRFYSLGLERLKARDLKWWQRARGIGPLGLIRRQFTYAEFRALLPQEE